MSQDLNTKTTEEITAETEATTRRGTLHTLISPTGQPVRVTHNAVAARLAAGYRRA